MRCHGRNSIERNAFIAVRTVGTTNNHTYNHRLLCTKMADAWADLLTTSPRARDGNVLYIAYITLLDNYSCVQFFACKHSKHSGKGGEWAIDSSPGSAPATNPVFLLSYSGLECYSTSLISRTMSNVDTVGIRYPYLTPLHL